MKKRTPELLAIARRLAEEGARSVEIGRALGVHRDTARRWAHPEVDEQRRANERASRERKVRG